MLKSLLYECTAGISLKRDGIAVESTAARPWQAVDCSL